MRLNEFELTDLAQAAFMLTMKFRMISSRVVKERRGKEVTVFKFSEENTEPPFMKFDTAINHYMTESDFSKVPSRRLNDNREFLMTIIRRHRNTGDSTINYNNTESLAEAGITVKDKTIDSGGIK